MIKIRKKKKFQFVSGKNYDKFFNRQVLFIFHFSKIKREHVIHIGGSNMNYKRLFIYQNFMNLKV